MGDIEGHTGWLLAVRKQASGQLEEAADGYMNILRRSDAAECGVPDEVLAFVIAQASNAYTAVADWEGLEAFLNYLEVRCLNFCCSASACGLV